MTMTENERWDKLAELELWFACNDTEFDKSAIGFHNWLKKNHPHLIKQ